MNIIKGFFRVFINSIARILGYLFIGVIIALIFSKTTQAQTYQALDSVMSTTYYEYFSGVVSKLGINDKYKAFTYECSSYSRNCYYLAYGPNLENYIRFNYISNSYQLEKGIDNNFKVNGNLIYSNEKGLYSSLDKGGNTNVQISILISLCAIFLWFVLCKLFKR